MIDTPEFAKRQVTAMGLSARTTVPFAQTSAPTGLTGWLARASGPVFVAYTGAAAFATYFCMYAFRKPFDATTLSGAKFAGTEIELKTACVVGQIVGYMVSKYLGTRVCSEARPAVRPWLLVGLILVAENALAGFAVAPPDWKPVAMFLNGLPLGMVFGLVVLQLEGRRTSELLIVGLCSSFIIAGAMTRDVGRFLMSDYGVPEAWMPAATGALFFLPFVAAVWLLHRVPPPSEADRAARGGREPMDDRGRRAFVRHFGAGLGFALAGYFLLTAFRDYRDHYGIEIFTSLGLADRAAIFSRTERWAMLAVVVSLGLLYRIRDHRRALVALFALMAAGFAVIGGATAGFRAGWVDGFAWSALVGVGLYLAYVPFNAFLFERMMAAVRFPGTAVFAVQLADGVGYSGSVLVQLLRDLLFGHLDRLAFFQPFAYVVSAAGLVLVAASGVFVLRRTATPFVADPDDRVPPGSVPDMIGQGEIAGID